MSDQGGRLSERSTHLRLPLEDVRAATEAYAATRRGGADGEPLDLLGKLRELARRRHRRFQPVQTVRVGTHPFRAMCVVRDADGRGVFALVDDTGLVVAARTDAIDARTPAIALDGFERKRHEILSLVADGPRPGSGRNFDLWVICREWEGEDFDVRVWKASLTSQEGDAPPLLRPVLDEGPLDAGALWLPQTAKNLPEWLGIIRCSASPDGALFDRRAKKMIGSIDRQVAHAPRAMIALGASVCLRSDGQRTLFLKTHPKDEPRELSLDQVFRTMALSHETDSGDPPFVAVLCDRGHLVIWKTSDKVSFEPETLEAQTTTLGWCPEEEEERAVPDLLVAYRTGMVERLRYLPEREEEACWQAAWHALGVQSDLLATRLTEITRLATHLPSGERERGAALQALCVRVLEEIQTLRGAPGSVPGGALDGLLAPVLPLFRAHGLFERDAPVFREFSRLLREVAGGQPEEYIDVARALARLLVEVYPDAPFSAQAQLDPHLLAIERAWPADAWGADQILAGRIAKARVTADRLWEDRATIADDRLHRRVLLDCERAHHPMVSAWTMALTPGQARRRTRAVALPNHPQKVILTNEAGLFLVDYTQASIRRLGRFPNTPPWPPDRVVALPGERAGCLLAWRNGTLIVCTDLDGDQPELKLVNDAAEGLVGDLRALAACRGADGETVVVVGWARPWSSTVRLLVWDGSVMQPLLQTRDAVVHGISVELADVAACSSGQIHLILAGGGDMLARLYKIDPRVHKELPRHLFEREMLSRVQAFCFDRPFDPEHVIAAKQSGRMWCFRLDAAQHFERLRWIQRVEGTIVALRSVLIHERPAVVAVTEDGLLSAWDVQNGHRVWRRRVYQPIADVGAVFERGRVFVVTLYEGLLVFRSLSEAEQNEARQDVEATLERLRTLRAGPGLVQGPRKTDLADGLLAMRAPDSTLAGVFAEMDAHERWRICHELAARHPARLVRELTAIKPSLTAAEIVIVVLALPDGHPEVVRPLLETLYERACDAWDEEAIVTCLRYLRTRCGTLSLETLLGMRPPDRLLTAPGRAGADHVADFVFLRLALAHALVGVLMEGASIPLAKLVYVLGQLPPDITLALRAIAGEWRGFEPVRQLAQIVEALLNGRRVDPKTLHGCQEALAPHRTENRAINLFWCILTLSATRIGSTDAWVREREGTLAHVRVLRSLLAKAASDDPPAVIEALELFDPWFPQRSAPEPHTGLADRRDWWSEMLGRLDRRPLERPPVAWTPVIHNLSLLLREKLRRMARCELEYLSTTLRGAVRLVELTRLPSDLVTLVVRITLEGDRPAEGGTLTVEAVQDAREGLLPLDAQSSVEQRTYRVLRPGTTHDFTLRGRVRADQRRIRIRVRVAPSSTARVWRVCSEDWYFDLPDRGSGTLGHAELVENAPMFARALTDELAKPDTKVRLIGAGRHFSRDLLLALVQTRADLHAVDLDRALEETGPMGRLGELTPDFLIEKTTFAPSVVNHLLVMPTLMERFLRGEAPRVFLGWFRHLQGLANQGARITMVVDLDQVSQVAAVIDGLHCDTLHLLLGRAFLSALEGRRAQVLEEVVGWFERRWGLPSQNVRWVFDRLGYDFELILDFDVGLSLSERLEKQVADVLTKRHNDQRLRRVLRYLPGLSLALTVLGALASVRLSPSAVTAGMCPRVDVRAFSPRQGSARNLAPAGVCLHAQAAELVRREGPPDVEIQGFGVGVAPAETASSLARIVHVLSQPDERRALVELLQDLGVGWERGGVFLPYAPFRRIIDEVASTAGASAREVSAHDELTDADRHLATRVPFENLGRLPNDLIGKLFARPSPSRLDALRLLSYAWSDKSTGRAVQALSALYEDERFDLRWSASGRPDDGIASFANERCAVCAVGPQGRYGIHAEYLLWYAPGLSPEPAALSAAVDRCIEKVRLAHKLSEAATNAVRPRVIALGPGVVAADPERRVALLGADALLSAFRRDEPLAAAIRFEARVRSKLMDFSPFQTEGAIPPDSPAFVGRREELEFIQKNIRKHSVLLVGGRRMGKTSLLNRLRQWVEAQEDLRAVFLDLQGVNSREGFLLKLKEVVPQASSVEEALQTIFTEASSGAVRRQIVFCLNEVDRLLWKCPELFEQLRAFNDAGTARFVMTGYGTALGALGEPQSALYHFVKGPGTSRALPIGPLSEDAALELCALLEANPLGLVWRERDREEGLRRLLRLSYRIPWLLQAFCARLLEIVEEKRRGFLCLDDVEALEHAYKSKLWEYIQEIQVDRLIAPESLSLIGGHPGAPRKEEPDRAHGRSLDLLRAGVWMVLTALARELYFLPPKGGGPPVVSDLGFAARRALDPSLSFTVEEARQVVDRATSRLALEAEQQRVCAWLEGVDLRTVFRALTLTPVLEIDPDDNNRFAFFLHIFPIELQARQRSDDATLNNEFIKCVARFLQSLNAQRLP